MIIDQEVIKIVSRLSRSRGSNMTATITQALSEAIGAEHVFAARLSDDGLSATTEAYARNGVLAENFTYALTDTPCAIVAENNVCCYNGDVQQRFPADQLLVDMDIKTYVGAPLFDSQTSAFGIIVALYERHVEDTDKVVSLFTLFSGLLAGNIERREKQQALNISDAIIEAMDEAVLLTNAENLIISANKAFSVMTGYAQAEILGQKPDFLSSNPQPATEQAELSRALREVGFWEGEVHSRKKTGEVFPELMRVKRVFEPISKQNYDLYIHRDLTDLTQAREEAYFNKNFDNLTGLPNRHLFLERVAVQLQTTAKTQKKCAIICVDLDEFQAINTQHNQSFGNELLRRIAHRLQNISQDIDVIGHLGSDEFAICINNLSRNEEAQDFADLIVREIRQPFTLQAEDVSVTATVGCAVSPDDGSTPTELLAAADQAMVHAKSLGKNQSTYFTKAIRDSNNRRLQLKKDLQIAIDQGEIVAAFQPIICACTGNIVKLEALARWPNANPAILPDEFIPSAEEFGLCNEIGNLVLRQSCAVLERLNQQNLNISISVNRSVAEFKAGYSQIRSWLDTIDAAAIRNDQIGFEITESLLAAEQDELRDALYLLKEAGAQILMDDFGTGYSSLSYLRSFPIDFLKIDRSFIMDIDTSHDARALTSSIIAMSRALGIKTVAEGIETQRQISILGPMGCDFYQGFYIAKPMLTDELLDFVGSYTPDLAIFAS